MAYYVYILQSQLNDSFYKGHSDDLGRRVLEHNAGKVSYSSKFRPWKLVWYTIQPTKSEAIVLERNLKNLTNKRLEDFIRKYPVADPGAFPLHDIRVQTLTRRFAPVRVLTDSVSIHSVTT